jgi:hypothetical protein
VSLHLLQVSLVYVDTLMIQQVLAEPEWRDCLTPVDLRALSPLKWQHVDPYRTFTLNMQTRLPLERGATLPNRLRYLKANWKQLNYVPRAAAVMLSNYHLLPSLLLDFERLLGVIAASLLLALPDSLDLGDFDEVFCTILNWDGLGFSFHVHGEGFSSFR